MKHRFLSLSFIVALLLASTPPTAHADSLPAKAYAPAQPRADDFEPWDFCDSAQRYTLGRQVSGLPWSRVWVERNWHSHKGR